MRSPLLAARLVVLGAVCLGTVMVSSLDILRGAPPPRPAEVKARAIASRPDLIEVSIQIPTLQILPPPACVAEAIVRAHLEGRIENNGLIIGSLTGERDGAFTLRSGGLPEGAVGRILIFKRMESGRQP